jgi:formylglycine-generating enzyme required for sulfatase activity
LSNTEKLRQAGQVIEKMGSLRCRPMLLAYIEDLMASPMLHHEDSEYRIYDALVQSWLNREQLKGKKISVSDLQDASIILATWLQIRKRRSISEPELDELISRIAKVKAIRHIEIKGRSLLNRNSEGNYRFSHSSVQEFLVAKLLLEKPVYKPKERIPMTDFIFRMIAAANKPFHYSELIDCRGLNLSGLTFSCIDLSGADLSEADLSECVFESARFEGTDFSKASLNGVCFEAGSLSRANFRGADLTDSKIVKTDLGITFLYIPPGRFLMGDDHDGPIHEVTLTTGFYMQTTPVTQGQWQAVMGNNPSHFKKCGPDCPVESVSWEDAQDFIQKLNEVEGEEVYRLPTEAQWEYACRAGTTSRYFFGDDESQLAEYAWYKKNSGKTTHPVAKLKPNDWGLYDMHGNVWEWCQDWYGDYPNQSVSDPTGPEKGANRVFRGGAWSYSAENCRTACRGNWPPGNRRRILGFRLVRLPGQPGESSQSSRAAEGGID